MFLPAPAQQGGALKIADILFCDNDGAGVCKAWAWFRISSYSSSQKHAKMLGCKCCTETRLQGSGRQVTKVDHTRVMSLHRHKLHRQRTQEWNVTVLASGLVAKATSAT
eukprot:1140355-Pelagomonas_calceolata.AAC.14